MPESVTGEFYARVTVPWVTLGSTPAEGPQTKPAACRWLRSRSNNSADQSSIVIQSLSEKSAFYGDRRSSFDDAPRGDECKSGRRTGVQKFGGNLPAGKLGQAH